mmetsp:Transcript_3755/g.6597  ORF Transcript_3755/g.6597 Transcript_3755/m.6597 type:complete len:635 (-) Transcript_3755:141-2045(-)
MTDLKIKLPRTKIKLKVKRPPPPPVEVTTNSISSYEDSGDEDEDDNPIDKRDLNDSSYRPNRGNSTGKRTKKASASSAGAGGSQARGATKAPPKTKSNGVAALCVASDKGAIFVPTLPDRPPVARHNIKGRDGKPLNLPENYSHLEDLTVEERMLLDKFSRTKRVVLKVSAKPGNTVTLARSKQEFERKRREATLDHKRNIVKRPRIHGLQLDAGKAGHLGGARTQGFGGSTFSHQQQGGMPHSSAVPPLSESSFGVKSRADSYEEKGVLLQSDWYSRDNKDPLVIELPNLSFTESETDTDTGGKNGNTLVIWATWPDTKLAERFAINISPTPSYNEKDPGTVVLYHFNPRDAWNKRLIVENSFAQKEWGKPDKSIQGMPIVKGKRFKLQISVHPNEFVVHLDGKHLSTFRNRCESRYLEEHQSLFLVVPVVETHFGDKEDIRIHKVWWGHQNPRANSLSVATPRPGPVPGAVAPSANAIPGAAPPTVAGVHPPGSSTTPSGNQSWHRPGVNTAPGSSGGVGGSRFPNSSRAPRYEGKQLFVSGLPYELSPAYSEMVRLFEPYGIAKAHNEPLIRIVEGKGFGFVTLETAESCDEAVKYLNGRPGQAGAVLQVSKARKKDRGNGPGSGGRGRFH